MNEVIQLIEVEIRRLKNYTNEYSDEFARNFNAGLGKGIEGLEHIKARLEAGDEQQNRAEISNNTEVVIKGIVRQHAKASVWEAEAYYVEMRTLDTVGGEPNVSTKYVWVRAEDTRRDTDGPRTVQ